MTLQQIFYHAFQAYDLSTHDVSPYQSINHPIALSNSIYHHNNDHSIRNYYLLVSNLTDYNFSKKGKKEKENLADN